MATIIADGLWVCQCCMLVHANGECGDSAMSGSDECEGRMYLGSPRDVCVVHEHHHDREPLSLFDGKGSPAMGLLSEEHAETCEVRIQGRAPDNYECDCERKEFSRSSCDGCGNTDEGSRYAFCLFAA